MKNLQVKRSYRGVFLWLNIPLWSIFLILSLQIEAQAQEKKSFFNKNNNQLTFDNFFTSTIKFIADEKINNPSDLELATIKKIAPRYQVFTSAQYLLAQHNRITRVTGVEVNQTNQGLEVILKTVAKQRLVPLILPEGKNLVIEIPDATLAFAIRNGVSKTNLTPEITEVKLTKIDNNSIRLTITGANQAPNAEVVPSNQNLVLSINSQRTTVQQKPDVEIIATGEGEEDNYYVPNASTATKTDIAIRDIPGSIQVIPNQVLEDRQITGVREAVSNVSGVTPGGDGTLSTIGESFIFRGFDNDPGGATFVNGFKRYTDTGFGRDLGVANIEQIEILKGPASVLYGQAEPGGILNITTKQPLLEPFYNVEGIIGNFDYYSPALDFSSPLNDSKTISYRFNADYRNFGSHVDFVDTESVFVAPVVSFDLGKKTNLTLEADYLSLNKTSYSGLPSSGTVIDNPLGKLPDSRFLDVPDSKTYDYFFNFGYRLKHEFSDNWSIRNGFKTSYYQVDEEYFFGIGVGEDNRTLERDGAYTESDAYSNILQTDVLGKIQTGSIKHDLLFGLELGWTSYDLDRFESSSGIPAIDIFNPVYESIEFDSFIGTENADQNTVGLYAQDLVSLGDKFKVLLGGRLDFASTSYENLATQISYEQDDNAFSPRVGLVYQPIKPVSLYTSWSRSFQPSQASAINADNTPFEPTKGEQFEAGVKTEFLDGKLATTLAAYQITKENVVTDDPNDPAFSIQVGEQQSKGIELDVSGKILPGWNIIASYAYTDTEVTKDNSGNEGNQLDNVSPHSASLWTTYEVQDGGWKGFGLGGGLFFIDEREGDLENTFTLPSYVRTDAVIYYRRKNWQTQLNFKNLFDVDYYEGASFGSVFPGATFTVQGSFAVEF
jgi:iron complex outermembrane recepter protein